MDFGLLNENELKDVNFKLPPDGYHTPLVLKKQNDFTGPEFYVGCAKWGRKEWVDLLYPPKTREAQFLETYIQNFNSIELNASFYAIPAAAQILKWKETADKANKDFIFCPKFSKVISHMRQLKNADAETDLFLERICGLGKYLGPAFLQLSDTFGPKNMDVLQNYLQKLPYDLNVFVEVRHKDWFSDVVARKEVFDVFSGLKKGTVITDTSGRRDCLHMELTVPSAFIRFVGNGTRHQRSDYARIDEWAERISSWLERGLEKVYFFLHQHDEKDTPMLAQYTVGRFNEKLGSKLQELKI